MSTKILAAAIAMLTGFGSCECTDERAGVVYDAQTRLPVSNADVTSYADREEEKTITTDTAGRYSAFFFESSLGKCQTLLVDVTHPAYQPTGRIEPRDTIWLTPR